MTTETGKKNILLICQGNLSSAPRFLETVEALKNNYNIWAAGYESEKNPDFQFLPLQKVTKLPQTGINFHLNWPVFFRKIASLFIRLLYSKTIRQNQNIYEYEAELNFEKLSKLRFDLIIAHHLYALPLATRLKKSNGCKLIYNAHEYYTRQFEKNRKWVDEYSEMFAGLSRKYLRETDQMWTVGENIRQEYIREFGKDSTVVNNSKPYHELKPTRVQDSIVRLIHHGAAIRERKIERMIEMMKFTDPRFQLTFMLVGNDSPYLEELKKAASALAQIRFIEPVKTNQIIPTLHAQGDIGCYLLEPEGFNMENSLPNKFFEFIQARLAVVTGPSSEMQNLILEHGIGAVAKDFSPKSMADTLNGLSSEQINELKRNTDHAARKLSSENNRILIQTDVERLIRN